MKGSIRLAVLFPFLALLGCTTYSGVKPIYPDVGNPNWPTVVDGLQPTFQWEAHPDAESYDFIIYEGIKTQSFFGGTKWAVGREVYYREGLQSTKHQVDQPLKPSTEYYWSVRTRRGSIVSRWSLYDYEIFLGTAYMKVTNQPFIFKTPDAREQQPGERTAPPEPASPSETPAQ